MLVSDIKDAVKQKGTSWTFGTKDWDQLIPRAVLFYSGYNPRLTQAELTTVTDQSEYALPSGCILVKDCLWYKGAEISANLLIGSDPWVLNRRDWRPNMPSDAVIDDINDDALLQRMRGDWEQWKGNDQLHLSPTPTIAGNSIHITYTSNHVLSNSDTEYATIPDEDLYIVTDLVLAGHIEALAMMYAVEGNWSLGQQRETRHHIPDNAMMMVSDLRSGCINKYGGVAVLAYPGGM